MRAIRVPAASVKNVALARGSVWIQCRVPPWSTATRSPCRTTYRTRTPSRTSAYGPRNTVSVTTAPAVTVLRTRAPRWS